MFSSLRTSWVAAVVCGWLLSAGLVSAALVSEVKDDAGFFRPETIRKANAEIKQIKDRYHKDLTIETFKTVPAGQADEVKQMSREERGRYFHNWARDRAFALEVNGIYVLICRDPGRVQVEVGNETQQRAFTLANRDELVKILDRAFEAREYDQGLLEGIEYVRRTLASHAERGGGEAGIVGSERPGAGLQSEGSSGWGGLICTGLVVLLIVWLVIAFIRMLSGARRRTYADQGPGYGGQMAAPGYGGGGFMSSMLGGLFGAAAGNWMYDRFFGSDTFPAGTWGGGAGQSMPPETRGTIEMPDTDYSGAGSDFGSSGDPGGGDFSGGDFSGGDDTGGGDF